MKKIFFYLFLLTVFISSAGCGIKTVKRMIILSKNNDESSSCPKSLIFFYSPPTYTIAVVTKSVEIHLNENNRGEADIPIIDGWLRINVPDNMGGTSLTKEDILNGGEFILYNAFKDPKTLMSSQSDYKVIILPID